MDQGLSLQYGQATRLCKEQLVSQICHLQRIFALSSPSFLEQPLGIYQRLRSPFSSSPARSLWGERGNICLDHVSPLAKDIQWPCETNAQWQYPHIGYCLARKGSADIFAREKNCGKPTAGEERAKNEFVEGRRRSVLPFPGRKKKKYFGAISENPLIFLFCFVVVFCLPNKVPSSFILLFSLRDQVDPDAICLFSVRPWMGNPRWPHFIFTTTWSDWSGSILHDDARWRIRVWH